MDTSTTNPRHLQAFRDPLTSETILIPTRFDNKTGEHVILWRDIQSKFRNVECIMLGNELVLSLVDDNFDLLKPERISYHPGAALDVVVPPLEPAVKLSYEIPSQASCSTVSTAGSPDPTTAHIHAPRENGEAISSMSAAQPSITAIEPTHACQMISTVESSSSTTLEHTQEHDSRRNCVSTVLQQLSNLTVATAQVMEKSPDTQSTVLITETQQSLQQLGQLVRRSPGCVSIPAQISTVTDIQNDQPVTVQDATFHVLQKILENQQHILNHQITLRNEVRAVARQTLEVPENSIPRLFVVLPKPRRRSDAILKPFRKQFRLFFLCDCGSHTESGRETYRHKIHLAMHEGYDLDKVDEFFDKYGTYVLTIMKMLKIGFTVAGVAVPGLAHLGIAQGIESTAKTLDMVSRNCRPLLDDASASLRNQIKGDNELVESTSKPGGMDFSNLKALYGSELRQLKSFLRHRDPERVLGNLNRMVTRDGDVRWVCNNHHPDRSAAVTHDFAAIVRAYNGSVSQDNTHFYVVIKNPDQAKKLYDRMVPGIQFLMITLQWEVAQEDLRTLESAATGAGITELILVICSRKSRRGIAKNMYNPLVQLMCNGHLKSLTILSSAGFYQRVNKFPIIMTSQLQELGIHSLFSPNSTSERSALKFILKQSPHLRSLLIATNDSCGVLEFLKVQISRFPNLEDISWKGPGFALVMELSQGKIQHVAMGVDSLDDLSQDGYKLIRQGGITELEICDPCLESPGTLLEPIILLLIAPKLAHVRLRVHPCLTTMVVDLITEARSNGSMGLPTGASRISVDWRHPRDFEDSRMDGIRLNIRENSSAPSIELRILDAMIPESRLPVFNLIQEYGWSIEMLETNRSFTDVHAMALDISTQERGSKIISLHLCPRSLTFAGLACMDRIIERSHNISDLRFNFLDLEDKAERKKAIHLLGRHKNRICSLSINGESADEWLSDIVQ
ncbi:hypothetical protein BGX34_008652, partial [Mortierella sp. NVP85]